MNIIIIIIVVFFNRRWWWPPRRCKRLDGIPRQQRHGQNRIVLEQHAPHIIGPGVSIRHCSVSASNHSATLTNQRNSHGAAGCLQQFCALNRVARKQAAHQHAVGHVGFSTAALCWMLAGGWVGAQPDNEPGLPCANTKSRHRCSAALAAASACTWSDPD